MTADMTATPAAAADDPLAALDPAARATLSAVADHLIPAAHGMPSAEDVVGEARLRFVLAARPDLAPPLVAALRPELGADVPGRLATLQRDEPGSLAVLQFVIVAGYYTDKGVRDLIGYAGQEAIEVKSWVLPPYIEEGLIDKVLERGAVWRDPTTGRRAVVEGLPKTYAERFANAPERSEGGHDGPDGA